MKRFIFVFLVLVMMVLVSPMQGQQPAAAQAKPELRENAAEKAQGTAGTTSQAKPELKKNAVGKAQGTTGTTSQAKPELKKNAVGKAQGTAGTTSQSTQATSKKPTGSSTSKTATLPSECTLQGTVVEKDSDKQTPVEAVEVLVSIPSKSKNGEAKATTADNKGNQGQDIASTDSIILSTLTDENGKFSVTLKPGTYHLTFRQMGEILRRDTVKLTKSKNLGNILIDPTSIQLGEVMVKAQKKLLTYEQGKMYFNVKESPYAEGFSAKEVLQHIPGMDPNPDKLAMIGKDGLIVLINGRRTNMSGEQLKHYLQSIESDKIEKVEVQTNPSPEYAASGNPGVINIILKKNAYLGWDGSIFAMYEQHSKPRFAVGGNINYSNKYIMLAYSVEYWNERQKYIHQDRYEYSDSMQVLDKIRHVKPISFFHDLSFNIFLTKNMDIGFISSLELFKETGEKYVVDKILGLSTISEKVDSITHFSDEHRQMNDKEYDFSISPYYEWRIDEEGKKLSVNYNYTKIKDDSREKSISDDNYFHLDIDEKTDAVSHIGRVGLEMPFDWVGFEAGGSYGYAQQTVENQYDMSLEKHIYKEQIGAFYANGFVELDKWDFNAGVRYEHTYMEGIPQNGDDKYSAKYGNWFPFANIGFQPNNKHTLTLGYNRRIRRPHVSSYNTTKTWYDSYQYSVGNPDLKPVLSDNVELKYIFSNLYLRLSYNYMENGTSGIQEFIEEPIKTATGMDSTISVIRNSSKNCLRSHRFGGNISYTYRHKIFTATAGGSLYYSTVKSSESKIDDSKMKGLDSRLYCKFMFNIGKHTTLSANYWYDFPGFSDGLHSKSTQALTFGAKWKFFKNSLIIDLRAYDVLGTVVNRFWRNYRDSNGNKYIAYGKNDNDNRYVSIEITYRFGNHKTKQADVDVDTGNSRLGNTK